MFQFFIFIFLSFLRLMSKQQIFSIRSGFTINQCWVTYTIMITFLPAECMSTVPLA